jgi:chromatin remodeling complex protein RSC6
MSDIVEQNLANDILKNDTVIINQILKKCDQRHTVCKKVNTSILYMFDQNKVLSVRVLDEFIKFITIPKITYLQHTKCTVYLPNIQKSLITLFALYQPSISSIHLIIDDDGEDIMKLLLNYDHILDSSLLTFAIINGKHKCANLLSKYNNLEVSVTHLNEAISKNMIEVFNNIINRKIQPLPSSLTLAIHIINFEMVTTILTLGIIPTETNLEEACLTQNAEMIKYFLDLKLRPTKICFKNIIQGKHCKHKYNYNINYNQRLMTEKGLILTNIVDILINYGYVPTYEDILYATKEHVKINNIELYDIKFNEKYIDICIEEKFYPYEVAEIKQTITYLEKTCRKSGNLSAIKQAVISGIVPNEQCLLNAATYKSNIHTMKFLVSHGAPVTLNVLEIMCNTIGNKTLLYILDEYKKNINKANINNEYNKNKEIKVNIADENEHDNENENENENDNENNKNNENQPKKKGKILVKGKCTENKEVIVDDINVKNIITINKPEKEIKPRETININHKLQELFGLNKTSKYTFTKLKQCIFEYINTTKLYDNDNKMLIKIDEKLSSVSDETEGNYVNFIDFDNFVKNIFVKNK